MAEVKLEEKIYINPEEGKIWQDYYYFLEDIHEQVRSEEIIILLNEIKDKMYDLTYYLEEQ